MIDVPEKLSEEQEQAVEALSKTMSGDPRAGLFAQRRRRDGGEPAQDAAKAGEK